MIPKETIDSIISRAILTEVAADFMPLKKSGKDMVGKCPICGKDGKGKGMFFEDKKDIFKCFSCDTGGKGAVSFLMTTQNMDYIAAIKWLGDKYGVDYDAAKQKAMKDQLAAQRKLGKAHKSFCDLQLESSGLTYDDVKALVYKDDDTSKQFEVSPFTVGTLNEYYQLIPGVGMDMVINYYDLDGRMVMYKHPKRDKMLPFFRVRFQNPEARKDKFGKPIKYYSPPESGTHLYVPEAIRKLYRNGNYIETLYIQEGEKKAEKSCKHGILSVGVMGIHNIGRENVMPKDLQLLIQKCNVKRIVFVLDSDWQDISMSLKSGDNPQKRPLSFYYAVRNFKDFMISFRNIGVNLEIFFGSVKKNEAGEKGIDDVLAGSLKGHENDFLTDISEALNSKSGDGKFVRVFKITGLTDYQLKDFWKLNNAREFAEAHKELLIRIPEFTINKTKYRFNENGEFELAEPVLPEERFWDFDDKGNTFFRYKRGILFLENRGYGRLKLGGSWKYVHFANHIATVVERVDMKLFVLEVTKQLGSEAVEEMMIRGGHQYLADHVLENMRLHDIKFETTGKTFQNMHFREKFVKISANSIDEFDVQQRVESIWADQIIDFSFNLTSQLVDFTPATPELLNMLESDELRYHYIEQKNPAYYMTLPPEGQKCHFLMYLLNTSNFHWQTSRNIEAFIDPPNHDVYLDISMHLLSKLTALGYMAHKFHNASVAKAVVAVDGKLSEVGSSHGRTGKSLFGKALSKIMPQVYIGGKSKTLTEDQFLFEEIDEKIQNVFIDDVRTNIDFEYFFPNITGQWKINAKGNRRFTLPEKHPIKLFFSTNHMINGEGSSFTDRVHYIVFSDYYSDTWKPVDEFGQLFFDEWDQTQWNLFYNLVATSLQLYFRFGLVVAPSRNIEKRRLRQMMGEEFLTWAEEYYSPTHNGAMPLNLECKIPRKELYDDFKSRLRGKLLDFYSTTRFGKCIKWFCQYKGYHFNPHRPNEQQQNIQDFLAAGGTCFIGIEDKSSGVEYFTVSKDGTNMPLIRNNAI